MYKVSLFFLLFSVACMNAAYFEKERNTYVSRELVGWDNHVFDVAAVYDSEPDCSGLFAKYKACVAKAFGEEIYSQCKDLLCEYLNCAKEKQNQQMRLAGELCKWNRNKRSESVNQAREMVVQPDENVMSAEKNESSD